MITVLLADDHAIVRDALRYLLEQAGNIIVVDVASNGQEAVDKVSAHRPDVAIIDVSMPVMGGIEATRQIRICSPETRILMLSMHHTHDYLERSLMAGAIGYILKDSAGRELALAVHSAYQGDKYFSKPMAEFARRYFESQV